MLDVQGNRGSFQSATRVISKLTFGVSGNSKQSRHWSDVLIQIAPARPVPWYWMYNLQLQLQVQLQVLDV